MNRRIAFHIGFWLMYWLMNSYVEVFLANSSFADLPFWQRMWKGFGSRLVILPLEIGFSYYTMYIILPRYFKGRRHVWLILEFLTIFTIVFTLYRLLIPGVLYPFIYQMTYPSNTFDELLPRYIYTSIEFLSVAGIALTIKLLRMRVQQLEKEKHLTEEKLQTELRFLRSQTNPHFLFNTLNNVYALARKKSDAAAPVVMKLSKLLRFMLYECNQANIPIKDELRIIEDYISLEKLRYNNRLEIQYEADIDCEHELIAPLLLLPLVENAFTHGTSETRFDAFVNIQVKLKKRILQLSVENAKEAMDEEPRRGIGLPNVSRQLDLLYPNAHTLDIREEKDFFGVSLKINLKKYAGTNQVPYHRG